MEIKSDLSQSLAFSVVIPFFNERDNVPVLLSELRHTLEQRTDSYEIILVDDGSTDGTLAELENVTRDWRKCTVLPLLKNGGQAAALLAGIARAQGQLIVILDGDGQNDPADIPAMLEHLGYADMIAGVRVHREDSLLRRSMSRFANTVRSRILGDGVHDSGCALKVFRREVAGAFLPIRTLYSFMPALAVTAGFRVIEHPVNHRPRTTGVSKYGLGVMLWRPLVDMLGIRWFQSRHIKEAAR